MLAMETNLARWKAGLSKTSQRTLGKLASFFGASEISADTWDELETLLIQADLGLTTSQEIIAGLRAKASSEGIIRAGDLLQLLEQDLLSRLIPAPRLVWEQRPSVILIAGVNGSGKTTTIAKLGRYFLEQGMSVEFIAADTFRAAAVEQLQLWGERLDIPVVSGQQDGDPGAVVYDGIQAALARKRDLVLIDTAGRLHTRYNLMEELKKVDRVAGKALPGAPHARWLVMDATTGQNALAQAQSFQEAIPLDGIILAKLDSSSKGGMAFTIQEKLHLPILFAGLGEAASDLAVFDPASFVAGILDQK
jgi:fused signal recognition particle receptor